MSSNRDYATENLNLRSEIEKLKQENQELKEEINELSKDELCFEKRCDKLENAIEILKDYLMISVMQREDEYTLEANDYGIPTLTKEEYDILNEVLGE